ncbi:SMP-30/gluconolactonase/LRE family protein, partial [bacterium]|nr:SMP-30/gluconolactonase/LRE family protein [bacterium]
LLSWGSFGTADGQFNGPMGIDLDASGNVYVADFTNHRVQKFDGGGVFLAKWGTFGSGDGEFMNPRDVAVDAAGNVYVSDELNHRIQKFDGSGGFLLKWGSLGTANGQFDVPHGIAFDAAGNVYVADSMNHRVQVFDASGTFLRKWGVFGTGAGQFRTPLGLDLDTAGNVYVTEYVGGGGGRLQKFTGTGGFRWMLAAGPGPTAISVNPADEIYVSIFENHRVYRYRPEPAIAEAPLEFLGKLGSLLFPAGVAVDSDQNAWVSEHNGHRVQKFDRNGNVVMVLGTLGTGLGQFSFPWGVAVDAADNVYTVEALGPGSGNRRVQKFGADGEFLLSWGTVGSGPGQFSDPRGIAVGPGGEVYVSDVSLHRVEKFDASGTFLLEWGTPGGGDGQFNAPWGLATDAAGDVYVADRSNSRVQKFDADGNFLTKWGSSGTANGEFSNPYAVSVDANGDVFVLEYTNPRVQKFDNVGSFLTIWGSSGSGDGQFVTPYGMATGANGDVYVADDGNSRVQKFGSLSGRVVAVTDVEGDQGGQVRLGFTRAGRDYGAATDPVVQYEAYRRIDAAAASRELVLPGGTVATRPRSTAEAPVGERISAASPFDAGWDFVGSAPAHGQLEYNLVAPTLADSTETAGIQYSVFFIRAATGDPDTFFDSAPDSGYSVDNLAPAAPTSLQLANTDLLWDEAPEADFQYFTIYGSPTGDLGDAVVIDYAIVPAFDVAASPFVWYLVTATDFAGNEGEAAAVSNPAVDAPIAIALPAVFALKAPRPSPFRTRTTIAFDVPVNGRASVSIYDVSGRLVRSLVNGEMAAGSYEPSWDGTDDSRRTVVPGVYFVRMESGGFDATRKLVRLR